MDKFLFPEFFHINSLNYLNIFCFQVKFLSMHLFSGQISNHQGIRGKSFSCMNNTVPIKYAAPVPGNCEAGSKSAAQKTLFLCRPAVSAADLQNLKALSCLILIPLSIRCCHCRQLCRYHCRKVRSSARRQRPYCTFYVCSPAMPNDTHCTLNFL